MYNSVKYFIGIIIFHLFFSCNTNSSSTIVTNNGYKLKYHNISGDTNKVHSNCIVNLNILAKDENQKVVFSSNFTGLNGVSSFYYDSTVAESPFNDILLNSFFGDSLSFEMSSTTFYRSLFGRSFSTIDSSNQSLLNIHLKILGYNTYKNQIMFHNKIDNFAQIKENELINSKRKIWDTKYLNIFKSRGLYAIRLSSEETFLTVNDSNQNHIILDYSIHDLYGRKIYQTPFLKPEYYEKNKDGQLLDGFQILIENFNTGDSIIALIPSDLLFGPKGSFVNQIPPYSSLEVNLKIK